MLATMRQNLILTTAVLVGGVAYLQAADPALGADGLQSATVVFGGPTLPALLPIVAATLSAVVLGAFAAATGHPLSGIFTMAAALGFLAISGGSIDAWLYQFGTPEAYRRLILEDVFWGALVLASLLAIGRLHASIRPRLPRWLRSDEGTSEPDGDVDEAEPPRAGSSADSRPRAWAAGGVAAVAGGIFGSVLLQTASAGQVFGGLVLAFVLAGLVAHRLFPTRRVLPILVSPLVVGLLGHAWVGISYVSQEAILAAHFSGKLAPLGLALPVYYASAGVAGAAMGVGWSHSLVASKEEATPTVDLGTLLAHGW